MGRPKRSAPGGWVYHVLNQANARMPIFTKDEDFIADELINELRALVAKQAAQLEKQAVTAKDRSLEKNFDVVSK